MLLLNTKIAYKSLFASRAKKKPSEIDLNTTFQNYNTTTIQHYTTTTLQHYNITILQQYNTTKKQKKQ